MEPSKSVSGSHISQESNSLWHNATETISNQPSVNGGVDMIQYQASGGLVSSEHDLDIGSKSPSLPALPTNAAETSATQLVDPEISASSDRLQANPSRYPASNNEIITFLEPIFDAMAVGYPLLNWPLFMDNISQIDPDENSAWKALLETIVAIGILFEGEISGSSTCSRDAQARFENAYMLLPELLRSEPSLFTIEALVVMAIFTNMKGNARETAYIVSSAARMYHLVTLRKDPERTVVLGASNDRHRCAFWALYILDQELTSQCGIPPVVENDEFGVVAHRKDIEAHMKGTSPVQRLRCEVAIMESIIYRQLYHRKAFALSISEFMSRLSEIDFGMVYWPRTILAEYRPDLDNPTGLKLDLATAILHLSYYHSATMVHWSSGRYYLSKEVPGDEAVDPLQRRRLGLSQERYKKAARATLSLSRSLPRRPFLDLWRLLCYPVSASISLFIGLLVEPSSKYASSDVWTIRSFRQFIEKVMLEEGYGLHRMLNGLLKMEELAQDVVDKANSTGDGTKGDGVESTSQPKDSAIGEQAQLLKNVLIHCTHPMYIAKALMTNIQNRDEAAARVLCAFFGVDEEDSRMHPAFMPESMTGKEHKQAASESFYGLLYISHAMKVHCTFLVWKSSCHPCRYLPNLGSSGIGAVLIFSYSVPHLLGLITTQD
ncbi:hypothetical protein F5Y16DRAFT_379983 [Xylariaceae sp. FL0255]|nr:hypothetical protein F5Y16DRAFT_379983 [Xylariaceae sp. FL0255]